MAAFRKGDQDAGAALADLFYPELRRLAAARMKGERVRRIPGSRQPWSTSFTWNWLRSRRSGVPEGAPRKNGLHF